MLNTLKELCALSGVSSWEDETRAFIRAQAEPYADSIRTDALGNLIVCKKGRRSDGPKLLLAASVGEQMLYIDAGLGVGVSNAGSYISTNPHVRCLWITRMSEEHFVLAWHRENVNSAIALFTNFTADYIHAHGLTE